MVTFHGAVKMTATGTDALGGRQARWRSHDRDCRGLDSKRFSAVRVRQTSVHGIAKDAFLGYSTGPLITATLITLNKLLYSTDGF